MVLSPPLQGVTNQDDSYWERFWDNPALTYEDFFVSISADDVRQIRNNAAGNLTALCFKLVERLSRATQSACTAPNEQACGECAQCVWYVGGGGGERTTGTEGGLVAICKTCCGYCGK